MPIDPSNLQAGLTWRWRHFSLFSVSEWHEVLRLRTAVFVVEQECPYQEVDDKDPVAWHLELHHDGELIGTLRILPPGIAYQEPCRWPEMLAARWCLILIIALTCGPLAGMVTGKNHNQISNHPLDRILASAGLGA